MVDTLGGMTMEVFKVMVSFTDSGDLSTCDAINYKNGIWLVPYWLGNPKTGLSKPVRIVRVDQFGLQQATFAGCKYILQALTLSKAVLEGRAQPRPQDEVVESPEIEIRLSGHGSAH